ncbi:MAG TPA: toll/interleukin-1 receptor domain-containing protein [Gemmataceae bacterium]|jgi:hypothetical protein|nr:toll/interleukin-1 receptor domain-containing protein [Gemmataceae bacterium]
MKNVFVAFAFRPEYRDLAGQVDQLLGSHGVHAVTGERLGGETLTPAVQKRIEQSDGLVAILTRDWAEYPWVKEELDYARAKKKNAIALMENDISLIGAGAYAQNEYIPLDRVKPLPAFLALSDTIGVWKQETGRVLKVRILPPQLALKLGLGATPLKCRHRFCTSGKYTDWKEVEPVPEPGGTFVFLEGVQDDHTVQLEVADRTVTWASPATPQWVEITLSRREDS